MIIENLLKSKVQSINSEIVSRFFVLRCLIVSLEYKLQIAFLIIQSSSNLGTNRHINQYWQLNSINNLRLKNNIVWNIYWSSEKNITTLPKLLAIVTAQFEKQKKNLWWCFSAKNPQNYISRKEKLIKFHIWLE